MYEQYRNVRIERADDNFFTYVGCYDMEADVVITAEEAATTLESFVATAEDSFAARFLERATWLRSVASEG